MKLPTSCVLAAMLSLAGVAGCKGDKEGPVAPKTTPEPTATPTKTVEPKGPGKSDDAGAAVAFTKACMGELDAAKKQLPKLVEKKAAYTEANTLVPLNELRRHVNDASSMAGLMQSVHPNEKVRDAARACEQQISSFTTELSMNRALYDAMAATKTAGLDADTKRLVAHDLRDFKRAGVDKDEATRTRIKTLKDELTKVGQAFGKKIADDTRTVEVAPADLKGLPADYIKAHPVAANGKVSITTNYPDYIPFMQYSESVPALKQLYIEFRSRGGEENEKSLMRILEIRAELAKLYGYANWADYITEDKMMKSAARAEKFIARVYKISKKRAARDYKELLARKRKDHPKAVRVEDYEKSYYENKVKAEEYAFDPQSVRQYFEYENVEKGLLDITSKIYDISYVAVKNPEVWHPSVKVYDVMRASKKIGRIYLDMHPREGKYKHAAQFTRKVGVKGVQLPEGVLVTNFPDPAASEGPALMEHGDVVTMFHEFGHLMHHIFGGQQRWVEQSGVSTEWDFVEAPSQMFEEWAWSYETLKLFAKNAKGEVIPEATVAKMRRADKFGLGLQTVQQLFYASMSLEFYRQDPAKLDLLAETKRLQAKFTPFRFVDGTRFYASFGHLSGYSAQYYTYMWSQVLAKDMLTPFKKNGLLNTKWTYAYRDKILAPGGTKDAADLVKDFLGRPFNYKAFEAYLTE